MKPQQFLFLFLLVIPIAFSLTTYPDLGGENDNYLAGNSRFNDDLTSTDYPIVLTSGIYAPLVEDLDNDGINEIIIVDDNQIKVYQNATLQGIDAIPLNLTCDMGFVSAGYCSNISNIVIKDMNGDGTKQIVYVRVSARPGSPNAAYTDTFTPKFVSFNGTALIESAPCQPNMTPYGDSASEYGFLSCDEETNLCLFATTYSNDFLFYGFNNDSCGNYTPVAFGGIGQSCHSVITNPRMGDWDTDGLDEVVFSAFESYTGAGIDEELAIFSVEHVSGLNFTFGDRVSISLSDFGTFGASACENHSRWVTAPHMQDIDGFGSNGVEVVVGVQEDEENFKMHSWHYHNSEFTYFDDFPEITNGEGELVSNIVRASAFPGSNGNDFCVMGYHESGETLDLVCASKITTYFGQEHIEYDVSSSGMTQIMNFTNFTNYPSLIHSIASESNIESGTNLNEILTPYGVFLLDPNIITGSDLELLYNSPVGIGIHVPVDYQQSGWEDILALTPTNLWYLDDLYSKVGCDSGDGCIMNITFNPCIEIAMKNGTQFDVNVRLWDLEDGDNVSGRVITYYNHTNVQDSGWSSFQPSNTVVPFSFQANETVNNGRILVYARDDYDNTTNQSIEYPFTVAENGAEYGDVTCTLEIGAEITLEEDEGLLNDTQQTALQDAFTTDMGIDSNFAPLVAILVIIVGGLFTAWGLIQAGMKDGAAVLYIPLFVSVALWLFFVYIDMIAAWTVIVSILIASSVFGWKIYQGRSHTAV